MNWRRDYQNDFRSKDGMLNDDTVFAMWAVESSEVEINISLYFPSLQTSGLTYYN